MWPKYYAGADLQVSLIFCFKPTLLSAHKLILLIYGDNTMTPGELRHGSYRTEAPDEDINPTIDTIEPIKTQAAINLDKYQEETRTWRNKKSGTSRNQGGRSRRSTHPKEQATRENA